MGKTIEKVMIKSFGDILLADKGFMKREDIRTMEVEAIVDTGAAFL